MSKDFVLETKIWYHYLSISFAKHFVAHERLPDQFSHIVESHIFSLSFPRLKRSEKAIEGNNTCISTTTYSGQMVGGFIKTTTFAFSKKHLTRHQLGLPHLELLLHPSHLHAQPQLAPPSRKVFPRSARAQSSSSSCFDTVSQHFVTG